jgi:tetratricopeptide (TPR) repeat protein
MAALLMLVTIASYWPVLRHDFINLDDSSYVVSNVHVQKGLTLESIKWAFFNPVSCNWHPLTMLSHLLDCQMFGLKPWGHHLTSVLLHAANTVLVFLLFRRLTGAIWRSWLVAAVFGLHPLHVESVAWVAERKDVLSAFFGLLALLCYAGYAQRVTSDTCGGIQTKSIRSRFTFYVSRSYWLALLFFALGLMSKPMLVTWPFVMLLLDYWPLERFSRFTRLCGASARQAFHVSSSEKTSTPINREQAESAARLICEKLPFFALALAMSVVAYVVQQHGGALGAGENLPPGARAGNALVSYCRYLGKMFWPADLAVFYPHPGYWPLEQVLLAGVLILGVSGLLFLKRQRYPFLLMGWLWFCGTLVPVIGLVQVGGQSMADRYTYIPSLGLLIFAIWGACELARRWRHGLMALSVVGSAAIVLCIGLTRQQLGYWKDSETLFRHTLEVTGNNCLAHYNLGMALGKKGQINEAISQYQEAIRLKPDYAEAISKLGTALGEEGRIDEAISQLQEAIRLKPNYADAYNSLGTALCEKGRIDEAIRQYQEAIRLKPDYAEACYNLGTGLFRMGQIDEAIRQYREAIRLKPDYAEAHYNLGVALAAKGHLDEAISSYREALRFKPDYTMAHINLGVALDRKGQIDEAIGQFQEAIRLKPDYAAAHNNLGTALCKKGQIDEAIRQYQEAIRLKPDYAAAHHNLERVLEMTNPPVGR